MRYTVQPQKVFLMPGELYLSDKKAEITTILGSCVSFVIYYRPRKVGLVTHATIPNCYNRCKQQKCADSVECAFNNVQRIFSKLTISLSDCKIWLFGGAHLLCRENPSSGISIGEKNIIAAHEILAKHSLKIEGECVGGNRGRKILFNTWTGEIKRKFIGNEKKTTR